LQGPGDQYAVEKFSGFLLVAEPTDGLSPETSAGNFQLTKGDSFARFSDYCPHAVKHASEVPKAEVQVRWIAPPIANGCVSFRCEIFFKYFQVFSHFIYYLILKLLGDLAMKLHSSLSGHTSSSHIHTFGLDIYLINSQILQ
jgi:Reeler domain-containing protein